MQSYNTFSVHIQSAFKSFPRSLPTVHTLCGNSKLVHGLLFTPELVGGSLHSGITRGLVQPGSKIEWNTKGSTSLQESKGPSQIWLYIYSRPSHIRTGWDYKGPLLRYALSSACSDNGSSDECMSESGWSHNQSDFERSESMITFCIIGLPPGVLVHNFTFQLGTSVSMQTLPNTGAKIEVQLRLT